MEQEPGKSNWKIWLYMTPVYIAIIIAIPLIKSIYNKNSGDEQKPFHFQEGETRKNDSPLPSPAPAGSDATRYEPEKTAAEEISRAPETRTEERQPAQKAQAAVPDTRKNEAAVEQKPKPRNPKEERKDVSIGFTKDYISYMVGKNLSPKTVSALLNNSFVVKGFMARSTVKAALGSTQGLQNYLSNTDAVNSFLGKGVIKAGMQDSNILNAVFSSELAGAVLNSPAMKDLVNHPDALNNMIVANPQLAMMLADPKIMNALTSTPQTAAAAGKMNIGR